MLNFFRQIFCFHDYKAVHGFKVHLVDELGRKTDCETRATLKCSKCGAFKSVTFQGFIDIEKL